MRSCIFVLNKLFTHASPGVHYLKDPRTKHFNFTPFLEDITQPSDFDYEALAPYITSSRDNVS